MYNNNGESKMDKTILVVEVIKYNTMPTSYSIKKTADTLEEASKYQVSLETLNDNPKTTYELFTVLGQFKVERIEKVKEVADEITF